MNENLLALPVAERLTPSVSLRRIGELPLVVVDHPEVRGAVTLQGAQVVGWQPAGGEPGLWLSERTEWTEGKAVRGGVPLCWPWFGPAGSPSHGFARTARWELDAYEESAEGVRLTLTLGDSEETRAVWPHAFALVARIVLGATCDVELEAHGDYETTAALHTYLRIGDIDAVGLTDLGERYTDNLRHERGTAERELRPVGRVERVYTEPVALSLVHDEGLRRTIEVRHRHQSDVVVWNPGPELSHTMTDLTDDGYRQFVCVETARLARPLVSAPGNPARLAVSLRTRAR
ncbi:D-hexose-6-phosphate mutarotase [Streptomyces sp. NPDC048383]|uniref:D-hexose-6-phosphate mutarotase n=1 Tax=Streptomyces sp. NPDC048383 TaxID=3155386 RepID=UPI00342E1A1D